MLQRSNNIDRFLAFVEERERIRRKKEGGEEWPWTRDPILREWSFCCVRREDDRVTRWIAQHWRSPHSTNPDLWFGMAVARFVNWPDSLSEIGWPVPWDRAKFVRVMEARLRRAAVAFGPAYRIMPTGQTGSKVVSVANLLDGLWQRRSALRPRAGDTLAAWHARLVREGKGLADFMAGQIVADVKQVQLRDASDWWSFAASGPGSRHGLNRIVGRSPDRHWPESEWRTALRSLHKTIAPELERSGIGRLCAMDIQGLCCEWEKFERVRLGEGTPKRRYQPPLPRQCGLYD